MENKTREKIQNKREKGDQTVEKGENQKIKRGVESNEKVK